MGLVLPVLRRLRFRQGALRQDCGAGSTVYAAGGYEGFDSARENGQSPRQAALSRLGGIASRAARSRQSTRIVSSTNRSSENASSGFPSGSVWVGASIWVPVWLPHSIARTRHPSVSNSVAAETRTSGSPGNVCMLSVIGCDRSYTRCCYWGWRKTILPPIVRLEGWLLHQSVGGQAVQKDRIRVATDRDGSVFPCLLN